MNVIIRPATVEDSAMLARIQVDSYRKAYAALLPAEYIAHFSYTEQEADWRVWLCDHRTDVLLVAVTQEGDIVGYALARADDASRTGQSASLMALHVRREWQTQGIGRALFARAACELQAQGARSLELTTLERNPVRAWYDRLGGVCGEPMVWDFCGTPIQEAVYTWPDLTVLIRALEQVS